MLLTLSGWTSGRIAEAFGVREDTVRLWRSLFMAGGIAALRHRVAPGPAPVKAACALAVAQELLDTPVADRPNWTLPRLAEEIDPSTSSGALGGADLTLAALGGAAKKGGFAPAFSGGRRPRHTLKGRQDADAVDRSGLRGQLLKAQAEAGDIVLLLSPSKDRGRVGSAHASLPCPCLGQEGRRPARARARPSFQDRLDRRL